jgi:hypothetical protein
MKGSVKMEGIDAFLSPIFALKNAANGAFGTFRKLCANGTTKG